MLRLAQRESEGGWSGQLLRETIIFMEESSQSNRMGKLYCASPTADLGHSVNSRGILAITSLTGPQTLPKHHPVPGWVLGVGPQERLQGLCFPQETGSSSPREPYLVPFGPELIPQLLLCAEAAQGI